MRRQHERLGTPKRITEGWRKGTRGGLIFILKYNSNLRLLWVPQVVVFWVPNSQKSLAFSRLPRYKDFGQISNILQRSAPSIDKERMGKIPSVWRI